MAIKVARHEMRGPAGFRIDADALRAGATRAVVGLGDDPAGQLLERTSHATAALLGQAHRARHGHRPDSPRDCARCSRCGDVLTWSALQVKG